MTTRRTAGGWSQVRRRLDGSPKRALIALVKDLYDMSPRNRAFLHARSQAPEDAGAVLEGYRRKIIEQFFPRRGFGKLNLAGARKAIRDYRKATGNPAGTVELMLTCVGNGTEFTRQFGDINEAYYNGLVSVLDDMVGLLRSEGAGLYALFRDRILELEAHAPHIGWGYGDCLRERVRVLEDKLAGDRHG